MKRYTVIRSIVRVLLGAWLGLLMPFLFLACAGQPVASTTPEAAVAQARATPAPPTQQLAPSSTPAPPARTATAPPAPTQAPVAQGQPAPDCGPLTPATTEGPYFKAGSPERTSLLEPGMAGTRLELSGKVLTADCRPVEGALVDLWQADANGVYDNSGYRLRGHQYTDEGGLYSFVTVIPGQYPGRTSHLHVKVQAPNGPVLTTQLYFPDDQRNRSDGLFRQELLVEMRDTQDGKGAGFNFILPAPSP